MSPLAELRTADFVAWIAEHSTMQFPNIYSAVSAAMNQLASRSFAERAATDHARGRVGRAQVFDALSAYYGTPDGALYSARLDAAQRIDLSILTKKEWLHAGFPLGAGQEDVRLASAATGAPVHLPDAGIAAAIERLAEVEVGATVLVNNPLYRLLDVNIDPGRLRATLTTTDFAAYALTTDLLEAELLSSLINEPFDGQSRHLPLRDLYLPTMRSALMFGERICAGGPGCLLAIARADDYALLIQERSSKVVNGAGRLSVIPKAFHQPTGDRGADIRFSSTVGRELEEELLGREDLEQLIAISRRAAPLHRLSLSEPMRWLTDHPGSLRIESTGFGINLLTGNYEVPCLVVIDDPQWWQLYGQNLEANWETGRLHCYSSLDTEGIAELVADDRWADEGLFAFLQGIQRLAASGSQKMALPSIDVDVP